MLPPGFPFAPGGEARLLVAVQPQGDRATRRNLNWIRPIARLRDGATVPQARKQLAAFEDALRERFPDAIGGVVSDVVPLRDELVGRVEPVLVLLFVCVNLVLLVACVNVANLLLARAAGRQKELSIRVALGAARGRLVRQLLTESALLAAAGGALGLLAAEAQPPAPARGDSCRGYRAGMPFLERLDVDGRVLTYSARGGGPHHIPLRPPPGAPGLAARGPGRAQGRGTGDLGITFATGPAMSWSRWRLPSR